MAERTQRIASVAAALTLLVALATAVLFVFDGVFGPDPVSNAIGLLAIVTYAVVGVLIASRLPRNACGWLLLAIGLGLALGLFTDVVPRLALESGRTGLAAWAHWANTWLLFAPVIPGIVLYLLVFPTGSPPSQRWRPLAVVVIALSAVAVLASVVAHWEDDEGLTNPLEVPAVAPAADAVLSISLFAVLACAAGAVVSVVMRFRRASAGERAQVRWLAVVAVLAASLLVIAIGAGALGLHAIGDPAGVAFLLVLIAGLPASAAVALLKHRLYGIEVVANRSVVFGSLAAAITVIYVVVVAGVGAAIGRSDRTDVLTAVAATALAAVAFQPARRRAQRFADRLIYGNRASPYELVATFTERLDDAPLDDVLPRMASLIAEGTGARRARVWLLSDTELLVVAAWPADGEPSPSMRLVAGEPVPSDDGALLIPVRHAGTLLGAISVTMPPQEPMTPATERLLRDLAVQAGLVLRNVALVGELRLSRQRIVAGQDEARRRLERDLHDGAQQRLVTLSLTLRMARERADTSGDPDLTTRLDDAERELAGSLKDLRELARGIHPAILTQTGVGAAVRSLAERSTVPVELGALPTDRFPAEVEATAYFVVSEALANVAKHAEASCAWVVVDEIDGTLAVDVRDDGNGGASLNAGSGLRGLADRVEAIGGRIDVRGRPGEGSIVHAEIPCASR